jgi:hypothetical protein
VVDAAGAIYVIGGYGDGSSSLQDVWVSTDGGARPGLGRGGGGGVGGTSGYYRGVLSGYHRSTQGYYMAVLQGY